MFTGIIQVLGTVRHIDGARLVIDYPTGVWSDPIMLGESIAVNGCCLTVVDHADGLSFDVSEETQRRTTLGKFEAGIIVNLERAMRLDDRFGGHFVQGHVDAVGELLAIHEQESSHVFRFEAPEGYGKYLVDKGSIAINGISLTVVRPYAGAFDVWVVPHTYTHTNLRMMNVGDSVNLEFDVIAKHVERLVGVHLAG